MAASNGLEKITSILLMKIPIKNTLFSMSSYTLPIKSLSCNTRYHCYIIALDGCSECTAQLLLPPSSKIIHACPLKLYKWSRVEGRSAGERRKGKKLKMSTC